MALTKKKYSEIPSDAIILTEDEALKYQSRIINNWKNRSDVYPIKYGPYVLGGASFFAGLYLNNYYRYKFKLLQHGRAASYLPICIIPAFLSLVTHTEVVIRDAILLKNMECPICLELRSSAIQAMIGCVFPFILAPVSSIGLAQKYLTYDVPYITKQPKKVFSVLRKISMPIKNIVFGIFVGQALLASVVTHFEVKSVLKVNSTLNALEKSLEQQ